LAAAIRAPASCIAKNLGHVCIAALRVPDYAGHRHDAILLIPDFIEENHSVTKPNAMRTSLHR
jgi:hypothetical protein